MCVPPRAIHTSFCNFIDAPGIIIYSYLFFFHARLSTKLFRKSSLTPPVAPSCNLKILSITDNSVEVVSRPQNAAQSFATKPAAMTSLPRFTVPATNGTCNKEDNSSKS